MNSREKATPATIRVAMRAGAKNAKNKVGENRGAPWSCHGNQTYPRRIQQRFILFFALFAAIPF
jgi:hypothetical protein